MSVRGVAQLVRVPEWGSGGRWFESTHPDKRPPQESFVRYYLANLFIIFFNISRPFKAKDFFYIFNLLFHWSTSDLYKKKKVNTIVPASYCQCI